MPQLSQETQRLLSQYQAWYQSGQRKEGANTLHVDEVASKVAGFYEKIRGVLDWREEHLLRRAAIERIFKRRLFLKVTNQLDALPLILELIRAGHFSNDRIEESKVADVQKALDRYIYILDNASPAPKTNKNSSKVMLQDWMSGVAACEIEEILEEPKKEMALIEYMATLMQERIPTPKGLTETEKNDQIYIAIHRALFKLDAPIIVYHLMKKRHPNWKDLSGSEIAGIAQNIYSTWEEIIKSLSHPLAEKFYRICERYDTPYLLLGDVISEDPSSAPQKLENPEVLEGAIRKSYQTRLSKLKSRLFRAAIYSTISIFLTKMAVVLAIEFPFDKYILQEFNYHSFVLNILIPTAIMLFLVVTTRPPGKKNLEKVIVETMKIAYESEKKDTYPIKPKFKRGLILKAIIFLFYVASFYVSFRVIWWGLNEIQFQWPSKIIFIIFFSLISFAGVKVRERAKELSVEEEKAGLLTFVIDWFSLPFLRLGKWMSGQWAKYNVFIVLIAALIDFPFQIFVEFLEQWRSFIKEKKEEIH